MPLVGVLYRGVEQQASEGSQLPLLLLLFFHVFVASLPSELGVLVTLGRVLYCALSRIITCIPVREKKMRYSRFSHHGFVSTDFEPDQFYLRRF